MADKGLDILEQYDFSVEGTSRGRGAYILKTDRGLKLLREYKGGSRRLCQVGEILEKLKESKKICVDAYVKNKDGEYSTQSEDGNRYIVKEWFDCRDCDIKNYGDIMQAVKGLGILHNELSEYENKRIINDTENENEFLYRAPDMSALMSRHLKEIHRIKKYLSGRNNRNEFEILAASCCDEFYEEGKKALTELNDFLGRSILKKELCHGDYSYHNICFQAGAPVIINFEKMNRNYGICDLYHIMRKIMEKYDWDIKLGHKILTEYDKVRTLREAELELLPILFSFPEKFWKILNGYYNSNKAWLPAKNLEKLCRVKEQNVKRLEFIKTIHQ